MCLISLSCLSVLYAENVQENITKNGSTEAIIQPSINQANVNDLYKIRMFFCNDGIDATKLTLEEHLQARPGETKNICFLAYNQLKNKVNISISFNEGKKDGKLVTCWDTPEADKFLKLIKNIPGWVFPLSLSPEEQVVKKFRIKIPKDSTENIYWCVYFSIDGASTRWTWDIFAIVVRKSMPITVMVTWDIYNFWRRDDINDTYGTTILKVIIAILALLLIVTIFKTEKRGKSHKKK